VHDPYGDSGATREGIDKYLFGQVRLLFEMTQNDKQHHLAYLEWYNITDVPGDPERGGMTFPRDPETKMAVAMRSGKFNIVSVKAIIRAVHMQPFFTERDSARKALQSGLDVYSFDSYVVNKFADRLSWEELF
jgi:hypothetical protein